MLVDVGFSGQLPVVAEVELRAGFDLLPVPMEYVMVPRGRYDKETGRWTVEGYSFVHISQVPNVEEMRKKLTEVTQS